MIPAGTPDDDLKEFVGRAHSMSQSQAAHAFILLAAHLMTGEAIDRPTFLRLADEAEAVMGR